MNMVTNISMAQPAQGHSHGPVISEDEAKAVATGVVSGLVESGKIDKGWGTQTVATITQEAFDGHLEWVVTFQNDAIEDQGKRTLYVFLTLGGEYLASNYTGE